MPPITKITDQNILVPSSQYPYAKWDFEFLNPVQSRVNEIYQEDANVVVAARTSAGKTTIAEMFMSYEIRKRGGKTMFLVPLRAVAQEKIDEWTDPDYHFKDLKISICTGDYRLTSERLKELSEADIIIMTSEMLNSRCRNIDAEKNDFLRSIGTLVVDESHLLTVPNRGDHLEVGLMKFAEVNPNAKIILLSATMPNVQEIGEWLSYSLNKLKTYVLMSEYRPVPLNIHYEVYDDSSGYYDDLEQSKIEKAMEIVEEWYPDDKFLIFSHTKKTGNLMTARLKSSGIKAGFHNGDLDKEGRIKLARDFKNDKSLRVVVATSTLAWGCNLPARRVIILGVHRAMEEVASYDITQMIGRSGRKGIDPAGDAYILLPESREEEYRKKLQTPQKIKSQLLRRDGDIFKTLAFHLVSEIHHENISTTKDIHKWYEKTLAYFQELDLTDRFVDDVLDLLKNKGCLKFENDIWKVTAAGAISSLFYYPPLDVADLKNNFWRLFKNNLQDDDYYVALSLANTDSNKTMIVSKAEKIEINAFGKKLTNHMGGNISEPIIKMTYCYYNLLNGVNTSNMISMQKNLKFDYPRLSQILIALDSMGGKWGQKSFFKTLEARIQHGVPSHLLDLCRIPNVAKVRATKLYESGIKSLKDFVSTSESKLIKILNLKQKIVSEMIAEAKLLM